MKRRGWRFALTVAALGLALVAGLVAFNWATVRDHVESWWFQATRETVERRPNRRDSFDNFQGLADEAQLSVIYDPEFYPKPDSFKPPPWFDPKPGLQPAPPGYTLAVFQATGYRIVEQRFPRRAYVVVGYPQPDH